METVNNGYTIRAQDEKLIRDLNWNEKYRNETIDWDLFEENKVILLATVGMYGCTKFLKGSLVELVEFENTEF